MPTAHISEHLANDRTFLAFLRTSVSLLSLGVAVNRFALYLVEKQIPVPQHVGMSGLVRTEQLGVGLVVAGGVLMVFALLRFLATANAIDRQDYQPKTAYAFVTTVLVVIACIVGVMLLAR
jgi:putative membrane protein